MLVLQLTAGDSGDLLQMFLGEARGLEALRRASDLVKVPEVLHVANRRDGAGGRGATSDSRMNHGGSQHLRDHQLVRWL